MPANLPPPPLTALTDLPAQMASAGFAVLDAASSARLCGWPVPPLDWCAHWDDLPPDRYLRDGGRYRRRRHGCFVIEGDRVRAVPHRAHWQPVEYNALHGGIERWFEPLAPALAADPRWATMLTGLATVAASLGAGASLGMTITDGMPSSRADSATACAWLPELKAITPARRCSGVKRASAL